MKRRLATTVLFLTTFLLIAGIALSLRAMGYEDCVRTTAFDRLLKVTTRAQRLRFEMVQGWPASEPLTLISGERGFSGGTEPNLFRVSYLGDYERRWKLLGVSGKVATARIVLRPDGNPWWPTDGSIDYGNLSNTMSGPMVHSLIDVPFWLIVGLPLAFIGTYAALQARRRWSVGRRVKSGQCTSCGYDMRMTPDQCPECGRTSL